MKKHITNTLSQIFGKFASCEFPSFVQKIINNGYVLFLKLDMSDYNKPSSYKSLNALFTRDFKTPRTLQGGENDFISPCDGQISEQGKILESRALQIKGFSYSIEELLTHKTTVKEVEEFKRGSFINLYLSPRDYHRFHAPIDMEILHAIQVSGKLYPVNFKYLKKVPSLFCENERVILACKALNGERFYLVFVGALNVGKMSFIFDENIQTNAKVGKNQYYEYKDIKFKKGDEIGRFEMGSTIVMLFEKQKDFAKELQKVKFGELLAT